MKLSLFLFVFALALSPLAQASRSGNVETAPKSCVDGHIDVFLEKLGEKVKRLLVDFGRFNRVTFELSDVNLEVKAVSGTDIGVTFQTPVSANGATYELSFDYMPFQYFHPNIKSHGWDEQGQPMPPISCRMTVAHPSSVVIKDTQAGKVVGQITLPSSFNIPIY